MSNSLKNKLVVLGAEVLAEALVSLANYSEDADELINRLLATPDEKVERIRDRLAALQSQDHYYSWREVAGFARKLGLLLQDIEASVTDPVVGLALVTQFFEMDAAIFEHCDDSGGDVGMVFSEDASDLFVHYAAQCTHHKKVMDLILRLTSKDSYCVRRVLIDCAGKVLPRFDIDEMISLLQQTAAGNNIHERRDALWMIESLARQIQDAPLFEQTRLASRGTLDAASYLDIAQVYLESGDAETAHDRLEQVDAKNCFLASQRDALLLAIYKQTGDPEKVADLLLQEFRAFRTPEQLEEYLGVVGHEQRDAVIATELDLIQKADKLRASDAYFLLLIGAVDKAEAYLLKRADQLDGSYAGELLDIAEMLESEHRHLIVSLIYRILLLAVFERGSSKGYPDGVHYLRKLDGLASAVSDWENNTDHQSFKEQLRQAHGRKRSFWSRYER